MGVKHRLSAFRAKHGLTALENKILRRIFGLRREVVQVGSRRLHDEELHNLQSSPNSIKNIKSRRLKLTGHVARMEGIKMHSKL
jgi:hypothetical protein